MALKIVRHVEKHRLELLQSRLEAISLLSPEFLALLSAATVIATFGLFQNSAAVIIGAMIIAPLMRPLVALSLATLTADTKLLSQATLTLATGTAASIVLSTGMAIFLRSLELSPEILGRTHPTLLDLGVAMAAGAIGAYCQTNEKLSDSLAGVAIAVALVPPLSVVGIGLAFHEMPIWTGAALLYITNLIGITMSGSLVFLIMGYTPLIQAKKGLMISAAIAVMLMVPLALSMRELILENQISSKIRALLKDKTFTFRGVQLREVDVKRFRKPMSVTATVIASDWPITNRQVQLVQDFLVKEIGLPIDFKLRIIQSQELTPSNIIKADQALEVASPAASTITVTPETPPSAETTVRPETQVQPAPQAIPATPTLSEPDHKETDPSVQN